MIAEGYIAVNGRVNPRNMRWGMSFARGGQFAILSPAESTTSARQFHDANQAGVGWGVLFFGRGAWGVHEFLS